MGYANEEKIKALLEELAELIPAGGGRLDVFDNHEEMSIVGDELAFLRLGVGLARGVFLPRVPVYGKKVVDTKAFDLFDAYGYPVLFELFEERPDLKPRKPRPQTEFVEIVGWVVISVLLTLIGIGAVTVFHWWFD